MGDGQLEVNHANDILPSAFDHKPSHCSNLRHDLRHDFSCGLCSKLRDNFRNRLFNLRKSLFLLSRLQHFIQALILRRLRPRHATRAETMTANLGLALITGWAPHIIGRVLVWSASTKAASPDTTVRGVVASRHGAVLTDTLGLKIDDSAVVSVLFGMEALALADATSDFVATSIAKPY